MISGIYKIRNTINDHFYIGSAVNFKNRWLKHKQMLLCNMHHCNYLQNAWNKYGKDSFIFEILEEVLNKSNLINREQYYFDLLKPEYNICKIAGNTLGLRFTVTHSAEHRRKLSLASLNNKSCVGRVLSDETKRKLHVTNMGKIRGPYKKRKNVPVS